MRQRRKILNVFFATSFEKKLSKTKPFFKKLEYCLWVESFMIENVEFPYQTALSKTNIKTNRLKSAKWTWHLVFYFFENWILVYKLLIMSWFNNVPAAQMAIFILFASAWVLFGGAFSLWEMWETSNLVRKYRHMTHM